MIELTQLTFADVDEEYAAFVEKFKPKKTTDDCYTPPEIYEVVLSWVVNEYGIDPDNIVRPFWPGGDYEREHYPEGCTVVDNPPFSIVTEICRTYIKNGIKFFLFAPYLTCFGGGLNCCHVFTGTEITYENGAVIDTAFVTNLESDIARTAPDLGRIIRQKDSELKRREKRELPKYSYPDNVMTAAMLGYIAKHGIEFRVKTGTFLRALDSQRAMGKSIFGGGYLLSEKAAAEKAAAEKAAAEKAAAHRWELSEREKRIIELLGANE